MLVLKHQCSLEEKLKDGSQLLQILMCCSRGKFGARQKHPTFQSWIIKTDRWRMLKMRFQSFLSVTLHPLLAVFWQLRVIVLRETLISDNKFVLLSY